eukprot:3801786-Pyramimonas_sp.AAC.1
MNQFEAAVEDNMQRLAEMISSREKGGYLHRRAGARVERIAAYALAGQAHRGQTPKRKTLHDYFNALFREATEEQQDISSETVGADSGHDRRLNLAARAIAKSSGSEGPPPPPPPPPPPTYHNRTPIVHGRHLQCQASCQGPPISGPGIVQQLGVQNPHQDEARYM